MGVPQIYHAGLETQFDFGLDGPGTGGLMYAAYDPLGLSPEPAGRSTWGAVAIGEIALDKEIFVSPAVGGIFVHTHGLRERPITWEGMLRVSDAGLSQIIARCDAWKRTPGAIWYIHWDDEAKLYDHCCLDEPFLEIGPPRRIKDGNLKWIAPYRVQLLQLDTGDYG